MNEYVTPKFSVIVPTFNREESLRKTLDSIAAQTYRSFEVIVADDGSTDGTKEIVESFQDKMNLKYLWEENWGGPARPRNRAAAEASGEWLAFLDSDDLWHPDKLREMEKSLGDTDVIYHALDEINISGEKIRTIPALKIDSKNPFMDLLLNGNRLANSATCVRKSAFDRVGGAREDKDIIAVEDYDLWLRLAKQGFKFKAIDQALGYYVTGGDNISALSPKFISSLQNVIVRNSVGMNFFLKRRAIQFSNYIFGMTALRSGYKRQSSVYFLKCILDVPSIVTIKSLGRICIGLSARNRGRLSGVSSHLKVKFL